LSCGSSCSCHCFFRAFYRERCCRIRLPPSLSILSPLLKFFFAWVMVIFFFCNWTRCHPFCLTATVCDGFFPPVDPRLVRESQGLEFVCGTIRSYFLSYISLVFLGFSRRLYLTPFPFACVRVLLTPLVLSIFC